MSARQKPEVLCSICDAPADKFTLLCSQCGGAGVEGELAPKAEQEAQQTPGPRSGGILSKQMNSRERLLDMLRNHKETYLRRLVTLQRAEGKINSLRLSEAEAVQEFLDLLAQSGI